MLLPTYCRHILPVVCLIDSFEYTWIGNVWLNQAFFVDVSNEVPKRLNGIDRDPLNECGFHSIGGWHKDGFHKKLKEWGVTGPIMEDQVSNWSLEDSKILRVCPVCGKGISREFDLKQEIENKRIPCECGFTFPYLDTTERLTIYTG